MEKIQVSEEFKGDYKKLIQAAQSIEAAVGGAYCKLNKMVEVRRQVDADLKTWWDKIAEEYKIDKSKDYFVDQNGDVNLAERPAGQPQPAPVVDKDAESPAPASPVPAEGETAADLT